ncbi:flagellar M-ring protein FliF [Halomonas sp. DP1Y21-3]|uniref:flagellar basal-body MS-ring/collar protein FliF n=1 Tax=Halomonas sp. DP1Y21-3 TaxID=2859080 RepID=UPI001C94D5CA|nr:flagellar basal-body MS-ring/collar protein FliF [Halomonas sp. DP1Y21-3]MBY6110954.1 flagellar M-ring protein FliF [Halomonas sp. DP1Y21-3]
MSSAASASSSGPLSGLTSRLRGKPLIPLMIGGAAAIALIIALVMWASRPQYRVLFSNLSEADGGAIITELDSRGVPYRFSAGGHALMVPDDQLHTLRLQLAEQGLPHGGNVGLELMQDQAFGISQFAEQINYQRGLEGELARSIASLGPVANARVHLALAKDSVFVRERQPAKASVVLTLEPGRRVGEGQVAAMVHLVSSSVPDLAGEDVTVIDQNGRLLSSADAGGLGLDGSQLDYVAEIERSYQRRIEDILAPLVGHANVRAQVTAQIDFSQREETQERYTPNQPPAQAAVRSRQTSLDINGQGDLASGIPGALSNTAPGTAASPIDNGDAAQQENDEAAADTAEQEEASPQRLRRDDVTNYELDRQVSHVQYQKGGIERLSAAVVVNYQDGVDEQGEATLTPLSAEQLAEIEALVRQAMGFSESRGDALSVVNSAFAQAPEVEAPTWWQDPMVHQLAKELGRYLLIILAVALLYLLVLRPLIRRYTEAPVAPAPMPSAFSARVGDDESDDEEASEGDSETTDGEDATYGRDNRRRRKASAYEQNLNDLRELAQEDPRMVAMIVRSWMNAND